MAAFLEKIEKPFMSAAGKLGQQPHLNAIRDGVVGALPLLIIGSLFMIVLQPPLGSQAALDKWVAIPWVGQIPIAITVLYKLVAVFVAFGVAYSLAKRYDLDPLSAGLLTVAALLLINGVQAVQMLTPAGVQQIPTGVIQAGKDAGTIATGKFLPFANLGAGGLFMALILGLIVPEVQRLARKYKLEIRMPAGVPPAVGRSFSALIPGLLILVPLWAIVHVAHIDLFGVVNTVLTAPVQAISASSASVFWVMLVIILIDSVLWLLGVHAVAILAPVAAIWLVNIGTNAAGTTHTLNTREALQFYIWVGGSGATIALPFLLLRARAASLRAIAKIGAIPALFNINEPLIFGVPVVMNVTLVLPFILAPTMALIITTLAVHFGLVPVPHMIVPWTLPGPVGAYLATGGAWQAAVLSLVNITIAFLIYWPFVRALDRRMAAMEAGEVKEAVTA